MKVSTILAGTLTGLLLLAGSSAQAEKFDLSGLVSLVPGERARTHWMVGARTELVTNGSFETGDFGGWNAVDRGDGLWYATNVAFGPLSGLALQPASDGTFQAINDQDGEGSHFLWQDVTIPGGHAATLNLVYWFENHAPDYAAPDTLDWNAGVDNQQLRIDVMNPASLPGTNDGVWQNLLITSPGDPASVPPTPLVADLTSFAGLTIRLRFTVISNIMPLQFGLDAVSIISNPPLAVEDRSWAGIKSLYR